MRSGSRPAQQAAVGAHILSTLLSHDSKGAVEGAHAALLAFTASVALTLAAIYRDDSAAQAGNLEAQLSR